MHLTMGTHWAMMTAVLSELQLLFLSPAVTYIEY